MHRVFRVEVHLKTHRPRAAPRAGGWDDCSLFCGCPPLSRNGNFNHPLWHTLFPVVAGLAGGQKRGGQACTGGQKRRKPSWESTGQNAREAFARLSDHHLWMSLGLSWVELLSIRLCICLTRSSAFFLALVLLFGGLNQLVNEQNSNMAIDQKVCVSVFPVYCVYYTSFCQYPDW